MNAVLRLVKPNTISCDLSSIHYAQKWPYYAIPHFSLHHARWTTPPNVILPFTNLRPWLFFHKRKWAWVRDYPYLPTHILELVLGQYINTAICYLLPTQYPYQYNLRKYWHILFTGYHNYWMYTAIVGCTSFRCVVSVHLSVANCLGFSYENVHLFNTVH